MKNSYPVPYIQDTLNMLYGNSLFTTLNLLKEYHQIEARETSRLYNKCQTLPIHSFTFWTNKCPCILPTLLEHVLLYYIGKFVILYIDDNAIFSSTFEDHLSHVT